VNPGKSGRQKGAAMRVHAKIFALALVAFLAVHALPAQEPQLYEQADAGFHVDCKGLEI